ncbi:hypothetical protein ElyMa_002538700 [Elysia marginata]|uniref:Uncharacterized protein n=1 Tax=Elysia marginata TaxID=1093978 RepID=A0AAV4GXK3_9GAST|nr:hypothetical protein ElyMa_002538700 [Elysia marginata]
MKFVQVTVALSFVVAVAVSSPASESLVDGLLNVLGVSPNSSPDDIRHNVNASLNRLNDIVANIDVDELKESLLELKKITEPVPDQLDGLTRDQFLNGALTLLVQYKQWLSGFLADLGFNVFDPRYDVLRIQYNRAFNESYRMIVEETKDLNDDELKEFVEEEVELILSTVDNAISSLGSFDKSVIVSFIQNLQQTLGNLFLFAPNITYDQFRAVIAGNLGVLSNPLLQLAVSNSG